MLDLLRLEGDLVVGDNAPYALAEDSDYSIPPTATAAACRISRSRSART